jgi:hypothetical protein
MHADILSCDGQVTPCIAFFRWQYHPQYQFPGHIIAIALKPISKEFDPLSGIGDVDLRMQGLQVLHE